MSNHVSGCISTVHPDLTEKPHTDLGNTCACMPEPIYYLMSEQLVLTVNFKFQIQVIYCTHKKKWAIRLKV